MENTEVIFGHGGTMRLLSFRLRKCATGSKNPRLSNVRGSKLLLILLHGSLRNIVRYSRPLILVFIEWKREKKERKGKKKEEKKKCFTFSINITTTSTRAGIFFRTRVTKISDYLATTLPYQRINRPTYTSFRIKQTLEPNDYLVT